MLRVKLSKFERRRADLVEATQALMEEGTSWSHNYLSAPSSQRREHLLEQCPKLVRDAAKLDLPLVQLRFRADQAWLDAQVSGSSKTVMDRAISQICVLRRRFYAGEVSLSVMGAALVDAVASVKREI